MSEIGNENPHTEYFPSFCVTYWDGNAACGHHDAWTHARIEGRGGWPRLEVDASRQDILRDVGTLLGQAFQAGRSDKARELRETLGIAQ